MGERGSVFLKEDELVITVAKMKELLAGARPNLAEELNTRTMQNADLRATIDMLSARVTELEALSDPPETGAQPDEVPGPGAGLGG